ncbi:MAG TPA: hypothetical protein DHW15_00965 [Bacteroidetes bacterium]|jgi:predicted alpha/beta superfamily hydrolase|nr:hypothetical protein [Bacteroidota bacterium]
MWNKYSLFCFLWCLSAYGMYAQLTIVVTNNAPASGDIYIAGPFNDWQPGAPGYKMQPSGAATYSHTFDSLPGSDILFKFTRGSWEQVEVSADGSAIADRMFYWGPGDTIFCVIESWADLHEAPALNPAIEKHVLTVPYLQGERTLRVYVPPGYATDTVRYPVIYMMDGQNLFDAATSYAGEWGVDELMDARAAQGLPVAIVVGIDHAGDMRLMEYSPWAHPEYGGGLGAVFANWWADSIKPFIDKTYRTLPDRSHTFIAGSSMGGLMSSFMVAEHNDLLGGAAVISASYWFSSKSFDHITEHPITRPTRVYFLIGGQEGTETTFDMLTAYDLMNEVKASGKDLRLVVEGLGTHNEQFWKTELPLIVAWWLLE